MFDKELQTGRIVRLQGRDGRKMGRGRGRGEVKESSTELFYSSLKNNYSHTHEIITHTSAQSARLTLNFHNPTLTFPPGADHNGITDLRLDHKVPHP